MRLTHLFVGIFVMLLFSVLIFQSAVKIGNEYNTTYDDDFTSIYTNLTGQSADMLTLGGEIGDSSPGGVDSLDLKDDQDVEGGKLKSGWNAISKTADMFNIFKGLINLLEEKFNIDPIFSKTAGAIFLIVLSLILLSAIMRNRL